MDRGDLEPLEPTTGVRLAASGTERILIGLALIALLGGAVVAVGNLLGVDFEATASSSPGPSADASATPRQTVAPRPREQFVVEPGPAPSQEPVQEWREEWIRAKVDLTLYGTPSLDATVRGVLPAGEAAFVNTDPFYGVPDDGNGWVLVSTPVSGAWIATTDGGEDLVTWYPSEDPTNPGGVSSIVPGPDRFLALAQPAAPSSDPWRTRLMLSRDGSSWSWVGEALAPYGGVQSVAWGPAGWLAITASTGGWGFFGENGVWLHRSADGIAWETLGRLPDLFDPWGTQLVASSFGYLLSRQSGYPQTWFSTDGIAWREMGDLPRGYQQDTPIVGIDDGFIALNSAEWINTPPAAFSVDGREWVALDRGPAGVWRGWQAPMLVQLGARVIAIESDPEAAAVRVWLGTIQHGELTWRRAPGVDATFRGATLLGLVSDGTSAWAFGWRGGIGAPVAWRGDGISWSAVELPDRVINPAYFAAGPSGVVMVGNRPSLRGGDPIFWHLTAQGSWRPEPSPVFPVVPERPVDCGQLPRDLLELQARSTISLLACFGATPVTVRGWTSPCDWCSEVVVDPQYEPGWLANPQDWLILSPVESAEYTVLQAIFDPARELGPPSGWADRWVEVTMHLDDPAALTCLYHPADTDWWYIPGYSMVDGCRLVWVVDEIREVSGP